MLFLLPVAAAVVAWRYHANKKNPKTLTPERQAIYSSAMTFLKDPTKLNTLADAFDKGGLKTQASNLRKRASLPSTPKQLQAAWQLAMKQGLSSKNPDAINSLADAFEKVGAMTSASTLRTYAKSLKMAATIPAVKITPPPQAPIVPLVSEVTHVAPAAPVIENAENISPVTTAVNPSQGVLPSDTQSAPPKGA